MATESSAVKRIMVDMSATLLHHGHIRLIQKARQHGRVIIGLTIDEEVLVHKGYPPELSYACRKEILEALSDVDEVVPVPWAITEAVLDAHHIDLLVHGSDNANAIAPERLLLFERSAGVSSSELRQRAMRSISSINNQRLMLTPGPALVLHENLASLKPLFGRGDAVYDQLSAEVLGWLKTISGQDEIVVMQGSATFALELAAHSFVSGRVLILQTGYYSERLEKLLPPGCDVSVCMPSNLSEPIGCFDWVLCVYTETSCAYKLDLLALRAFADQRGAKLLVDATGSIGLEDHHEVADVLAFSSCKGLFGLTGACFIAHRKDLPERVSELYSFNLAHHREKKVTGPYHALASLHGVMPLHDQLRARVARSKQAVMQAFAEVIPRTEHQPLLCTYIEGALELLDDHTVPYLPRNKLPGSILCHLGEVHQEAVRITERVVLKREAAC